MRIRIAAGNTVHTISISCESRMNMLVTLAVTIATII